MCQVRERVHGFGRLYLLVKLRDKNRIYRIIKYIVIRLLLPHVLESETVLHLSDAERRRRDEIKRRVLFHLDGPVPLLVYLEIVVYDLVHRYLRCYLRFQHLVLRPLAGRRYIPDIQPDILTSVIQIRPVEPEQVPAGQCRDVLHVIKEEILQHVILVPVIPVHERVVDAETLRMLLHLLHYTRYLLVRQGGAAEHRHDIADHVRDCRHRRLRLRRLRESGTVDLDLDIHKRGGRYVHVVQNRHLRIRLDHRAQDLVLPVLTYILVVVKEPFRHRLAVP